MLRIHDDMLHAITTMRPMLSAIERRDSDLARQLRRCAAFGYVEPVQAVLLGDLNRVIGTLVRVAA
jgi:hypothetical protein